MPKAQNIPGCKDGIHEWRSTTSDIVRQCSRCKTVEFLVRDEWQNAMPLIRFVKGVQESIEQTSWIDEIKEE